MLARAVSLGALLLLAAAPIQAQIYSWHDESGTLVLSNRPSRADAQTYAVADTPAFRATRPIPQPGIGAQFEPLIRTHAAASGVPAALVRAVIQVESAFDVDAT